MMYKLVYFCNGEKHVLIGSFDDIKHCVSRLEQFDDIKCICVYDDIFFPMQEVYINDK